MNADLFQFLGLLVRVRGLASQVNEAEFELSVSVYVYNSLFIVCCTVNTSYAMLSSGIAWNIPQVNCIFFVNTRALRRVHVYAKKILSDKWDIVWYTTRRSSPSTTPMDYLRVDYPKWTTPRKFYFE